MQEINPSINPLQILARALTLTGSINNLSQLSGISRGTLSNIFKHNYTTNMTTILRLIDFIDQNSNRVGRPFKKQTNFKRNELSA